MFLGRRLARLAPRGLLRSASSDSAASSSASPSSKGSHALTELARQFRERGPGFFGYGPAPAVSPRYHHVRFSEFERDEDWKSEFAQEQSVSTRDVVKAFEKSMPPSVFPTAQAFAEVLQSALDRVRTLLELRELPVPASLIEARRIAGGSLPTEQQHAVATLAEARALCGAALLELNPSLQGSAPRGIGADAAWSEAALADLRRPADLPADSQKRAGVKSVAEWRLALVDAYSALWQLSHAGVDSELARRAANAPVVGDATAEAIERSESPLSALGLDWSEQDSTRTDALARKRADEFAQEAASALTQWQSRRAPGRLSDTAPNELREAAEALEANTSLTAFQRAQLLQLYSDTIEDAQSNPQIGAKELGAMRKMWSAPSDRGRNTPWDEAFPVNTIDPRTGRPVPDSLFLDDKRPRETFHRFDDAAEAAAVVGPTTTSIADAQALSAPAHSQRRQSKEAAVDYHAYLASIRS